MPLDPRLRALADAPLFMLPSAAHALFDSAAAPARADWGEALRDGGPLAEIAKTFGVKIAPRADWTSDTVGNGGEGRPYELADGIATLPVRGALANRKADAWWGETSYESFRETLSACMADDQCQAILLDIDSPGGAAAGAMETAKDIRAASGQKPVVAFVDGMACSAAYALASGASGIVCAPSAMLGSIGVVMMHYDVSKLLDNVGIVVTLLHSGAYKTDGFPTQPLEKGAAARIQQTLDDHYDHFTATVGAHRPDLGEKGARKTEAGLYVGARAVKAGLADALGDRKLARTLALAAVGNRQSAVGDNLAFRASLAALRLPTADCRMPRASTMTVKLYRPGESHADHLIDDGKVDKDSDWSFSAEDGDALLGDDGDDWDNYASFHLGEDPDADEKTKARYKYPFGKGGKVYRSALKAIRSRAGEEKAEDIDEAAGRLLSKIDRNSEKEAQVADQNALAGARAEGASAERARISAILTADASTGRMDSALVFALETDMAPEAALKALAKTPAAAAAAAPPASRLDRIPAANIRPENEREAPANETERGRAAFAAAIGKRQEAVGNRQ